MSATDKRDAALLARVWDAIDNAHAALALPPSPERTQKLWRVGFRLNRLFEELHPMNKHKRVARLRNVIGLAIKMEKRWSR